MYFNRDKKIGGCSGLGEGEWGLTAYRSGDSFGVMKILNTGDGCPNLSLHYCKNHCIVYSNGGITGFVSCSSRKLFKKKLTVFYLKLPLQFQNILKLMIWNFEGKIFRNVCFNVGVSHNI